MAQYTFWGVVGTTLPFDPATDRLLFTEGATASELSIQLAGAGTELRIGYHGAVVRLPAVPLASLNESLVFADGSVCRFGSASADGLVGGEGADLFEVGGGGGADTVVAGGGNDIIRLEDTFGAGDVVDGGAGTGDRLALSLWSGSSLPAGTAAITGVERFDITNEAGSNRLVLQEGTLSSASAPVVFALDGAGIHLDGRAATTGFQAFANWGGVTLRGGGGADSLSGGVGADSILGGSGDDVLTGDDQDTLEGGGGADTLLGSGTVRLSGGEGSDRFVVLHGVWSFDGVVDSTTVADFEAADTLEFRTEAPHPYVFNAHA
ncbi:MAG TPA: calcium-binding protein, partial [Ramlibacter sp.]